MIKAVVFDMDGVLIDAREWHYEALNIALRLFGFEISLREHLEKYDGLPTARKLDLLTKEKGLPEGLHSLINQLKQSYTVDAISMKCRPTFNHEYALVRLKREGFQLAVASNSIRNTVEMMLSKAELLQYLDFYLSNEDVVEPKPDPEIYLESIRKLDLKPSEVLVLEDNENGIAAARAAGTHVLEIADPDEVTYWKICSEIAKINRDQE